MLCWLKATLTEIHLNHKKTGRSDSTSTATPNQTTKKNQLLKSQDAPDYMKEVGITSGYRQKLSYTSCITSCFLLHNETVNIWSHLLGFATFLYCLAALIVNPPQGARSFIDLLPLYTQLITYQVCLLSSALFHTFSCHSEATHRTWMQTDHFGIVVALFGTYVSIIYNVFHCQQDWRNFHLSVVTVIFIVTSLVMWCPSLFAKISRPQGGIPLSLFLALSLYVAIPFGHWVWMNGGFNNTTVLLRLKSMVIPFMIGGVGLCFYVSRFPEKVCKSGSFDLFGASHQVWHVMIFLGMFYWYHSESQRTFNAFLSESCPFQSENESPSEINPTTDADTNSANDYRHEM